MKRHCPRCCHPIDYENLLCPACGRPLPPILPDPPKRKKPNKRKHHGKKRTVLTRDNDPIAS